MNRTTARFTDDRRAVAELLAGCGPVYGDRAAAMLGWSDVKWWRVVDSSGTLFHFDARGWFLTEAGRAMLRRETK